MSNFYRLIIYQSPKVANIRLQTQLYLFVLFFMLSLTATYSDLFQLSTCLYSFMCCSIFWVNTFVCPPRRAIGLRRQAIMFCFRSFVFIFVISSQWYVSRGRSLASRQPRGRKLAASTSPRCFNASIALWLLHRPRLCLVSSALVLPRLVVMKKRWLAGLMIHQYKSHQWQ